MRDASGARIRLSPPHAPSPRLEHGPDDTTQKAAPSLLEGSYFSCSQKKSATSSLHLECSSSIFINRDARNLEPQDSPPNSFAARHPALSCASAFPTGTSTGPQKTFEKPTSRNEFAPVDKIRGTPTD